MPFVNPRQVSRTLQKPLADAIETDTLLISTDNPISPLLFNRLFPVNFSQSSPRSFVGSTVPNQLSLNSTGKYAIGYFQAIAQQISLKLDFALSVENFSVVIEPGTPGSDILLFYPDGPFEVFWGRNGTDALLGFDPAATPSDRLDIDLMIGDLQKIKDGFDGTGKDTFILGDWRETYYLDRSDRSLGTNQFATILDFQTELDLIQLHGSPSDYRILELDGNTLLFSQNRGDRQSPDLVAVLFNVSGLNLREDYFQFEGELPDAVALPAIGQIGTVGYEEITTVAIAPNGGIYLGGYTSGVLGETSAGSSDIWVAEYGNEGDRQWIEQLGSTGVDSLWDMATDVLGNVYLVGVTSAELVATGSDPILDVWVAKYDQAGEQQWIQQFGKRKWDNSFRIDLAPDGQTFALSGEALTPSQGSSKSPVWDPWVGQYSTVDGSEIWFEEGFGSSSPDESYGVAVDDRGSVFAAGWTLGDLGGTNAGEYDAWLAKFDASGERQWIRQFGSESFEFLWGVDTDRQGNAYVAGWTSGNLAGELAGSHDGLIAKYDTDGNMVWVKQFGGFGDDEISNLAIAEDDYLYVTGFTNGDLVGDSAASETRDNYDAFAAKYDLEGNLIWLQQFGSAGTEQARGIAVDRLRGEVYVTGITDSSLGATNQGSFDGWVAKLDTLDGKLVDFSFNDGSSSI